MPSFYCPKCKKNSVSSPCEFCGENLSGAKDPLFPAAIRFAVANEVISTSMLQRKFKLGYSRASQLIDAMESHGIVGPFQGTTPREVLITLETWNNWVNSSDPNKEIIRDITAEDFKKSMELEREDQQHNTLMWEALSKKISFKIHMALYSAFLYIAHPFWLSLYLLFVLLTYFLEGFVPIHVIMFIFVVWFLRIIYQGATPQNNVTRIINKKAKMRLHIIKKWHITPPDSGPFGYNNAPSYQPQREPEVIPPALNFDSMDGHQFEYFCADLLRKNGFFNVEVTQASGDYGIDVLAEKDGVTYAIQCKCYSDNIGNHAVQEAFSGKRYYNRMVAAVMTNRYFTQAAKDTAAQTQVLLWDRDQIIEMVRRSC